MSSADNKDIGNVQGRVIVTYGRSLIALMIAQSLGRRGVEVIGCDSVDMTVLSFSKFVKKNHTLASPDRNPDKFLDDLEALVKYHKPDDGRPYILMSAFHDARLIAENAERFDGLITLACPDREMFNKVHPKDHFARTAEDLGLNAPKTWLPEDQDQLEKLTGDMDWPVLIKPPDQVGGRGISKHDDADSLIHAYQNLRGEYPDQNILVQQASKGQDYCYCALYDKGTRISSMVYTNLRKYPKETGAGVVRETVDKERFDPIADELLRPLKWTGVVEIDFLWTGQKTDKPVMIEVNPRFWAGLDHSIKSGIDFPWQLYTLFTGDKEGLDQDAQTGFQSSLPGLAFLARLDELFDQSIDLDKIKDQWADITAAFKKGELGKAANMLNAAMKESMSFDEAASTLKYLMEESKKAGKISYAKDDPFIGLGILFVLGSLIRYGELPPEIRH